MESKVEILKILVPYTRDRKIQEGLYILVVEIQYYNDLKYILYS